MKKLKPTKPTTTDVLNDKVVAEIQGAKGDYVGKLNDKASKRNGKFKPKKEKSGSKWSGNDVAWYAYNPELLKSASTLYFSEAAGLPLTILTGTQNIGVTLTPKRVIFPGVVELWYEPMLGCGDNPSGAINIAARNIYSWVRHNNSGSKNYEAPDLFFYIAGISNVYSWISNLERIYGLINSYSAKNRNIPTLILQSIGLTYQDIANIQGDRMRLLSIINTAIAKLAAFNVPNDLPYFNRQIHMNSNCYKDHDSEKAGIFVYHAQSYLKWYPNLATGSALKRVTPTSMSLNDIETFTNDLLDAILQSEDFAIMSGDILKAYGESGVFKFGFLNSDYQLFPVYDKDVLLQIHNTTVLNAVLDIDSSEQDDVFIYQSGNTAGAADAYIICNPTFEGAFCPSVTHTKLIDFHQDSVTPEEIMEATRTTVSGRIKYESNSWKVHVTACMTEVVERIVIRTMKEGSTSPELLTLGSDIYKYDNQYSASLADFLINLEYFDMAPILQRFSTTGGLPSPTATFEGFVGDIDNFSTINEPQLVTMHEVALLSLFRVPKVK